ncbi:nuclear transport factor 2 family protein [Sphingobium estronivorans]|uniref:nuclear transport factor 2 family protein n=1 Tax=Sphingobium estronivorans TaxID=1577690 RepID=UPI00123B931C|nr:nuclear transport factor 2 family protein [Sphingobium estronivorans]
MTESDLRAIHIRSQIRAVMARYVQGVDHRDAALLKSCYHEDAYELHHIFNGPAHGFAEWRARQTFRSHHMLSESAVRIEGAVAYAETPHTALVHVDLDEGGLSGVIEVATHGWYLDLFSERGGEWKIDFQRVVTFHSAMRLIGSQASLSQGQAQGSVGGAPGDPFALQFALGDERPEPSHVQDTAASIRAAFLAQADGG